MNMNIKELYEEAQRIQNFLEITPSEDPNELLERVNTINVYLARTGKMLSEVKGLQSKAVSILFKEHTEIINMPATIAKQYISSHTSEIEELAIWIDRLNRTCVHQADNLRTLISFAKENLRLTKSGY